MRGLSAERINDFPILKDMFLADSEHKQFLPTPEGGFKFTDISVMDTALQKVEMQARQRVASGIQVVTIEFARTNYQDALQQFSREFINHSHVLFFDAEVETCLQRIAERVAHPQTEDDHTSLPPEEFRAYYGYDNRPYMLHGFRNDFPFAHSEFVDTKAITLEGFQERVDSITTELLPQMTVETQTPTQPLGIAAKHYY